MPRFAEVAIDLGAREVWRAGELQHLEPQAFDLLRFLLSHCDRVVSKAELLDAVWGDQFVSESALTTRIKEIRRALGDDGRTQAVIKNVRGRGYRFVAALDDDHDHDPHHDHDHDPHHDHDHDRSDFGDASAPAIPAAPDLVGREVELEAITTSLESSRLVTLVGPGGVGKTTLALHAAHRRRAVFVDLSSIGDVDGVIPAWRQAAGLVGPGASLNQTLTALASTDVLYVLDNCEHVIDRAAELASQLLASGGAARVLATSRERLGLVDEIVVPVGSLGRAAARSLFLDRVARVRPDFRLSDADEPELDLVLTSIDRLPLAIEMAAGRLAAMTIGDLRRTIDSHVGVLRSSHRHPTMRHRSISDLVTWSEELLEPHERNLFGQFAVFAGPVDIDDVVGVLADDLDDRLDVIDGIAALVDRSLLVAELGADATRYRMLETTKAHARLRLPEHSAHRHAAWFADAAHDADRILHTEREAYSHRRMTSLMPELRVAHGWARESAPELAASITAASGRWAHSRLRGEPARWASWLLPRLETGSPAWCDVAVVVAEDAAHRADYDLARSLAEAVVDGGSPRTTLRGLETLTDVTTYRGELEQTAELSEQLLRAAIDVGDGAAAIQGIAGISLARTYGGDPDGGRGAIEGFDPGSEVGPSDRAWLSYAFGEADAVDEPDLAFEHYERAIELSARVEAEFVLAVSRVSLAAALARHGEPGDAVVKFRSLLEAFRRTANLTHAVTAMRNVIVFLVRMGVDRSAIELLGALSGDDVKSTFGPEEAGLDACREVVERRSGSALVQRWMIAGRGIGPLSALDLAMSALEDVAAG